MGMGEVSLLLRRWSEGDLDARDALIPLVYEELKRLAGYYLRLESGGQSLQATALVHEAYLRLAGPSEPQWADRSHFFAVASRVMRHILVDHARRHNAARRDKRHRAPLEEALTVPVQPDFDLLSIDESLTALAVVDPEKARAVELRFFGGLSVEETAAALEISPATVKRHWSIAKLWLCRHMQGQGSDA
jgi:RNA polymerase sigma factor (TIGR02999 family)